MKIFISWSGKLSHEIALLLEIWLPSAIQAIQPFLSSEHINKGARWFGDVSSELEGTNFGILCLTHKNLTEPWILFEAGALAKSVGGSHVVPFLIDLSPSDLAGTPLGQFQATAVNKDDIQKLLKTINSLLDERRLDDIQLKRSFNRWWPEFETKFQHILTITAREKEQSTAVDGIVKELLDKSREFETYLRKKNNEIVDIRLDMRTKDARKVLTPAKWQIMINGESYQEIIRKFLEKKLREKDEHEE